MADIHVSGEEPQTVRTYEHLTTRTGKTSNEQKFVAKEKGVEYHPVIEFIGPSKDDPDFV
jgi:hypothetical protein